MPKRQTSAPKDELETINALARGGRNAWLSLLAALIFVFITLLGVRDVDFFITERETMLPLVGVSVPTFLFFTFAPLLIGALYLNLHFHLMKLWEAAGPENQRPLINGTPLSDHLAASFITDLALSARTDGALRKRPLQGLARFFVWALVFAATPLVLAGFWARSLPAHDELLTLVWCAVPFALTVLAGSVSWAHQRRQAHMRKVGRRTKLLGWSSFALGMVALTCGGWLLVEGTTAKLTPFGVPLIGTEDYLYSANLSGAVFVETPPGWLAHDDAQREHARVWCTENDLPTRLCDTSYAPNDAILLRAQQDAWCASNLMVENGVDPATTCRSFFVRADAQRSADWIEHRRAEIAALPNRDLGGADFRRADLRQAQMQGANLRGAQMQEADLTNAQMQGADLFGAQMQEADLTNAQMQEADLISAQMQGAELFSAQMQGADLISAQMQGADLSFTGMDEDTDLNAATLRGAALRSVDDTTIAQLRDYWDDIFADGSIDIGNQTRPDHWEDEELGIFSSEFEQEWRAWQATLPEGWDE